MCGFKSFHNFRHHDDFARIELDKDGINIEHTKGQIYALRTAIIFAEEGVDSNTIVRFGK